MKLKVIEADGNEKHSNKNKVQQQFKKLFPIKKLGQV